MDIENLESVGKCRLEKLQRMGWGGDSTFIVEYHNKRRGLVGIKASIEVYGFLRSQKMSNIICNSHNDWIVVRGVFGIAQILCAMDKFSSVIQKKLYKKRGALLEGLRADLSKHFSSIQVKGCSWYAFYKDGSFCVKIISRKHKSSIVLCASNILEVLNIVKNSGKVEEFLSILL